MQDGKTALELTEDESIKVLLESYNDLPLPVASLVIAPPLHSSLSASTPSTHSWLAARLLDCGVDPHQVKECEEALITNEGFVTQDDFSACPPVLVDHAYLARIGVVGLGVQNKVISIHRALCAEYRPQAHSAEESANAESSSTGNVCNCSIYF